MRTIERKAVIATEAGLTEAYVAANPDLVNSILVVTEQSAVEARIRDLQAKLISLGISDVTEEGSLILGGSVEVTPGLRKGVAIIGDVDREQFTDFVADPVNLLAMVGLGHKNGIALAVAMSVNMALADRRWTPGWQQVSDSEATTKWCCHSAEGR